MGRASCSTTMDITPRHRRSLEDWYAHAQPDQQSPDRGHPPPRSRSYTHPSPSKRTRAESEEQNSYFIGEIRAESPFFGSEGPDASQAVTVELKTAVRGICADYFESHLSPVLKCVQDSQKQLATQLEVLRDALDRKAHTKDVPTFAQVEDLVGGEIMRRLERNDVASLVRIQELAAGMNRKADVGDVVTSAQFRSFSTSIEQQVTALKTTLAQKANAIEVSKRELEGEDAKGVNGSSAATRIQCLITAASARFDRQLRDVKRQVRELQEARQLNQPPEEPVSTPRGDFRLGERWPGREMGSMTPKSDCGSDISAPWTPRSVTASLCGSTAGSDGGMSVEEKEELKRIRTLMAAAGTAFSRDIRDLRKKMSEVQDEMTAMRTKLPSK